MNKVDYIIVGLGIAGLCFAERLRAQNKTFVVINALPNCSTAVSGGVINPTVLKRFTGAWQAASFIEEAIPFYKLVEQTLETTIIRGMPIYRILKNVEEQNNWMVASEKQGLKDFLVEEIRPNTNDQITASMGYGEVKGGYALTPATLLRQYTALLRDENSLIEASFQYGGLQHSEENIRYKDIEAQHIIFAEGAAAVQNPFFPKELVRPNKGEYVIFRAPDLQLETVLKGPMMIIPLGNDIYKAGATFDRGNQNIDTTQDAADEIVRKVKTMITCDFELIDQVAGIRPTVKDRRPLIGVSKISSRIHFMNGLGTRGLMMAPKLSKWLYEAIEEDQVIPQEIDINRF